MRVVAADGVDLGDTGDTGPTAALGPFFRGVGILVAATLVEPGKHATAERESPTVDAVDTLVWTHL